VHKLDKADRVVLVLAPLGRDAAVIEQVLKPLEVKLVLCANLIELTENLGDRAAAAILTEEPLNGDGIPPFQAWIDAQPPWSDFPFVVLAARHGRRSPRIASVLAGLGNDVLLERPLNAETLLKAVTSAMRSRRRQYEARAQLERYEAIGADNLRLYEAEREARAEAEAANRAKDEFLATLSHELRTPLSAILGWTYVLQQRRSELGDLARGIDTIQRNAMSQARLIEDLLDMSRIIAGKVSLEVQTVVPALLIEQVISSALPAAQAKNIRIFTDVHAAMLPIRGDTQRLLQVFRNLLTNALKFTSQGGTIQISAQVNRDAMTVTVKDDGVGIAPEFLPHVFERFRQADGSTTRSQGGLGLGLAIVHRLVELHGGTVAAASPGLGQGASFEVRLPLVADMPDGAPAPMLPDSSPTPAARDKPLVGLRILLVEDDPDGRAMFEQLLGDNGAAVIGAASAIEALQVLRDDDRIQLLISDIAMPHVDGYEFLRRARAAGNDVPAIALTAFARPEDKAKALEVGFALHISKPVDPAALVGAVLSLARRADGG